MDRRSALQWLALALGATGGGWLVRRARAARCRFLRPPGAGPEPRFLARCIRCGQCVEACPKDILHLADVDSGLSAGTPYLVARIKPCDLCQGRPQMECLSVCPTGALSPLADRRQVRMGVAVVDPATCLPFNGVSCKACWHACPFPNEAIRLDQRGRPVVIEQACVGCGLCEHACLTEEPAIRVWPVEAADLDPAVSPSNSEPK